MEELQAQHRKERQDLQIRITQKKKQASKKTRKGINDECDRLEAELKAKQAAETAALYGEHSDQNGMAPDETLDQEKLQSGNKGIGEELDVKPADDVDRIPTGPSPRRKMNRQKARLARRAAEQEEVIRQAAEEAQNLPDWKQQERERMLQCMQERGLQEKEIRADGHCLYSAVADQMQQLNISMGNIPGDGSQPVYKMVRAAAADYIEMHQEDFLPFLEEPLPDYLHKVRDTGEWGGQLELMALAKTYGTDINVLQDFGRVEKIESKAGESSEKSMWLSYYKHSFGLGEHFNSLRKAG
ncbi:hypothetical protein M433DRAFT_6558 [Acidomyces richmondensis BFW]|nr:MAG: hypothetical protein FE78DRAFT_67479 [Acidomyces sp. 'richmondensis']KYG43156.1 hypothetical protein M433DRAFT_6558 [Acidomyces richmondensis BFW]